MKKSRNLFILFVASILIMLSACATTRSMDQSLRKEHEQLEREHQELEKLKKWLRDW